MTYNVFSGTLNPAQSLNSHARAVVWECGEGQTDTQTHICA